MNAVWLVGAVVTFAGLGLFVGGIVSAALEIRAEKRAGLPVTRPGWRKADREPKESDRYALPERSGWLVWPLVALGLPGVAGRYLERRGGGRDSR